MPNNWLIGKCIVSPAHVNEDYFYHAVVLIVKHSLEGAVGLVINRPNNIDIRHLLNELSIETVDTRMHTVLDGGPLRPELGLVLHTGQPVWSSSMAVSENICVTSSKDILQAIARNEGVEHYQLVLGFASWAPKQLETEVKRGDWGVIEQDLSLLFDTPYALRWQRANEKLGIAPLWFVDTAGHA